MPGKDSKDEHPKKEKNSTNRNRQSVALDPARVRRSLFSSNLDLGSLNQFLDDFTEKNKPLPPAVEQKANTANLLATTYQSITHLFDEELFDEEEYSDEDSDEENEESQIDALQQVLSQRHPTEQRADMRSALKEFKQACKDNSKNDMIEDKERLKDLRKSFYKIAEDLPKNSPWTACMTELAHRLHFLMETPEHPSNKWGKGVNALRCHYLVENIAPPKEVPTVRKLHHESPANAFSRTTAKTFLPHTMSWQRQQATVHLSTSFISSHLSEIVSNLFALAVQNQPSHGNSLNK